ncbi:nuclear transport factor 2 family protein [Nocardia sp. CNY236]|uniref:nuclear transport factor 2 family protein n=1 Tax=Nocardia sp. CNY236 TaxID=1169152 RepID=UPI0018C9629D|nr:nuclear transport factor 2 family protein [Nocardia sp. CNY236]
MERMDAARNKALLQKVFAATDHGDGRLFVDLLDDEVRWTIIGRTAWSGTYDGKAAVLRDLLRPLTAQFAGPNRVSAHRFVAEDDLVVVEARNHSVTAAGMPYPNRYCWVITMRAEKIVAITEYTDTQLIAETLTKPPTMGPSPK